MNEQVREFFSIELQRIDDAVSPCLELAQEFEKVAAFVSSMTRPELMKYRKKLQNDYFRVGAVSSAVGAGTGAGGSAFALTQMRKFVNSPDIKHALKKSTLPVSVVSGIVGAMVGPSVRKKIILKELVEVDKRLKESSPTHTRVKYKYAAKDSKSTAYPETKIVGKLSGESSKKSIDDQKLEKYLKKQDPSAQVVKGEVFSSGKTKLKMPSEAKPPKEPTPYEKLKKQHRSAQQRGGSIGTSNPETRKQLDYLSKRDKTPVGMVPDELIGRWRHNPQMRKQQRAMHSERLKELEAIGEEKRTVRQKAQIGRMRDAVSRLDRPTADDKQYVLNMPSKRRSSYKRGIADRYASLPEGHPDKRRLGNLLRVTHGPGWKFLLPTDKAESAEKAVAKGKPDKTTMQEVTQQRKRPPIASATNVGGVNVRHNIRRRGFSVSKGSPGLKGHSDAMESAAGHRPYSKAWRQFWDHPKMKAWEAKRKQYPLLTMPQTDMSGRAEPIGVKRVKVPPSRGMPESPRATLPRLRGQD